MLRAASLDFDVSKIFTTVNAVHTYKKACVNFRRTSMLIIIKNHSMKLSLLSYKIARLCFI